jgi:hypothetical protein
MLDDLDLALDRLLAAIEINRPKLFRMLQPGLSREKIEEKTNSLPFALTEEVIHLYMWRNGTEFGPEDTLADGAIYNGIQRLLTLDEAISFGKDVGFTSHQHWLQYVSEAVRKAADGRFLFPLFEDGCAGTCYVACERERTLHGPLIDCFGDGIDPAVLTEDLTELITILADSYERGETDPMVGLDD